MEDFFELIRKLNAFLVFITLVIFLKSYKITAKTFVFLFFFISVIFFILAPFFADDHKFGLGVLFMYGFIFTIPFLFWLLAKVLFDDEDFSNWYWLHLLWIEPLDFIYYFVVVSKAYKFSLDQDSVIFILINSIPYVIQIAFSVLAIIEAVKNKRNDLINARITLRYTYIVVIGTLLILISCIELSIVGKSDVLTLQNSILVIIFLVSGYMNFRLLTIEKNFLPIKNTEVKKEEKLPDRYVEKLRQLISVQKIFLNSDLTIKDIAMQLNLPEYKTRRLINSELEFRNFNAFLNHYRIEEAKIILGSTQHEDISIIDLAFQLGYNSLAPFNKAFKALTGVSPSKFGK